MIKLIVDKMAERIVGRIIDEIEEGIVGHNRSRIVYRRNNITNERTKSIGIV